MKNLIKHQCNHHLGKKEDGSNKSSSVMQVAKNMYRQELMKIVPVPLPDYTLAKLKKELAGEDTSRWPRPSSSKTARFLYRRSSRS
jgi:hypothetical protein